MTSPVLTHFDHAAPTLVHVDASGCGIGAVLLQLHNGMERVVSYASRSLSKPESNYSTTEKECLAVVWAVAKFRPYLFGRKFQVVSDHHSLCWLSSLKDPTGRLARWALRLQEYDMEIIYKSGRKHLDADCLSRNPPRLPHEFSNLAEINALDLSSMAIIQREDVRLRKIFEKLDSLDSATLNSYTIVDDILYKKSYDPQSALLLLVLPQPHYADVLHALHDEHSAGHLGFARTLQRVRSRFFWPRMIETVRQYVASCIDCNRRKIVARNRP